MIKSLAKAVEPEKFQPKKVKIEVDEKDKGKKAEAPVEVTEEEDALLKKIYDELLGIVVDETHAPNPVEFEKDDPTNWHIEFMSGVSNLRARNYKIN